MQFLHGAIFGIRTICIFHLFFHLKYGKAVSPSKESSGLAHLFFFLIVSSLILHYGQRNLRETFFPRPRGRERERVGLFHLLTDGTECHCCNDVTYTTLSGVELYRFFSKIRNCVSQASGFFLQHRHGK